jgi:hypothetical protein
LTRIINICITGHRAISDEQATRVSPVVRRALENIRYTVLQEDPSAQFVAHSPLAEGADTLFAIQALDLGIPLKVVLPYDFEHYLDDFSTPELRTAFIGMYERTPPENRITLNSFDQDKLDQLYLELGKYVADNADFLIAIWNEKPAAGQGGTGDVVAYALSRNKDVLVINPTPDIPIISFLNSETRQFDLQRREGGISKNSNRLAEFLFTQLKEYEAAAVDFNARYLRTWRVGFGAGLVEVLAFSLVIAFHFSLEVTFILSATEVGCLGIILYLVAFGRTSDYHSRYVHTRMISERLRIKQYFALLGYRLDIVHLSPVHNALRSNKEYKVLDDARTMINVSAFSVFFIFLPSYF